MPNENEYVDNGVPVPQQEQEVQEQDNSEDDKQFVIQKNPVKQGLKAKTLAIYQKRNNMATHSKWLNYQHWTRL